MARLSARQVDALKKPGRHPVGDGLYLSISSSGRRSWVWRGRIAGETSRREYGLGSCDTLKLSEARERALAYRTRARAGEDPKPKQHRTFEELAREVHDTLKGQYRNQKHSDFWLSSLELYAFPVFGARPIDKVRRADVLEALTRIWHEKPETARRVKQRVGRVFSWAIGKELYPHPNPVDSALTEALGRQRKKVQNHPSMPWREVPAFYEALRERDATSALCLRFLILTATRSNEARGAEWGEINLEKAIWTIPADRTKTEEEHRVPLCDEAVRVLKEVRPLDGSLVFPSPKRDQRGKATPLSVNAFRPLLRRMDCDQYVPHGFRSSFRDWSSEAAHADRQVAEAALAHVVTGVEGAYARSDLFDRRRDLMDAWGRFVTGASGKVVELVRA